MINETNTIELLSIQDKFVFYDLPGEQCFPCFEAGWGTGKSLSAILRGLIFSEESPNNLGMIVRKETTDLRDSTMRDFERYTDTKINVQSKSVKIYGSDIIFRHGQELDTAVIQNVNLGWFWIEQGDELLTDKIFWLLHGRLRRKAKRRSGWVTTNAGSAWINKLWPLNKQDARFPLFRADSWINSKNLPEDTLKNWKVLKDRKPDMYKQYIENSRDIVSGAVWPEFNPKYHIIPQIEIPNTWQREWIVDMATTGVVVCLGYVTDYRGNIIFDKEYYEEGKLVGEHARAILEMAKMPKISAWACKYAFCETQVSREFEKYGRLGRIADLYRDYNINLFPTNDTSDAGRERVASLLRVNEKKPHPFKPDLMGAPQLFITNTCRHTIEQMETYRKITVETDRGIKSMPVKKNDHCCEAVTRAIMRMPEASKEPEEITYDDFGRPNQGVYLRAAMEERELEESYRR